MRRSRPLECGHDDYDCPLPQASDTAAWLNNSVLDVVPDHYATLKIPRDASRKTIKKAAKRTGIVNQDQCFTKPLSVRSPSEQESLIKISASQSLSPFEVQAVTDKAKETGWAADILCDLTAEA